MIEAKSKKIPIIVEYSLYRNTGDVDEKIAEIKGAEGILSYLKNNDIIIQFDHYIGPDKVTKIITVGSKELTIFTVGYPMSNKIVLRENESGYSNFYHLGKHIEFKNYCTEMKLDPEILLFEAKYQIEGFGAFRVRFSGWQYLYSKPKN